MRSIIGRTTLGAVMAAALAAGAWFAATPSADAREQSAPPSVFSIDDLAFFAGYWRGELFGGQSEEAWFAPDGGTMLGAFRLISGGKTRVSEFLMITQTETGVKFYFKHYNTDYTTWEKDAPLVFDLVEIADNRAVFESSVQTNPNRLVYSVREDGMLSVLVEGEEDGKKESFEALFTRND